MKLIEIVVLMGAHCVSPVQHTTNATEAGKVHCAVVIEKDTQDGTLRIVPVGASREPEVVAVLNRLDTPAPAPTIAPAAGPPVSAAVTPAIAPPPPLAAAPQPSVAEAVAPAGAAGAEPQAEATKAAAKDEPDTKQAEQNTKSKCRGEAKPKWYTNAEGRRKYRCVVPG
jgi:hypothetical protein